jgi:hypothetical protein
MTEDIDEVIAKTLADANRVVAIEMTVSEWKALTTLVGEFKPGNDNAKKYRRNVVGSKFVIAVNHAIAPTVEVVNIEVAAGEFAPIHLACFNAYGDDGESVDMPIETAKITNCDFCAALLTETPNDVNVDDFDTKSPVEYRAEIDAYKNGGVEAVLAIADDRCPRYATQFRRGWITYDDLVMFVLDAQAAQLSIPRFNLDPLTREDRVRQIDDQKMGLC